MAMGLGERLRAAPGSTLFWLPLLLSSAVTVWGSVRADSDFNILEEAELVAAHMRKLAAEELGVFSMQLIKLNLPSFDKSCRKSS